MTKFPQMCVDPDYDDTEYFVQKVNYTHLYYNVMQRSGVKYI